MYKQFIARIGDESGIDPRVVAYYSPGCAVAEQYRSIRTYISSLNGGELYRSIIISSANRQEGKSVTAVNLAVTMAEEKEKKVVLVNCDFRQPLIEKLLNIDTEKGLNDYLNGNIVLEQVLTGTVIKNLAVLPSGNIPANPVELLSSQKMKDLIGELEKSFNYIIFDTPPIIPFADTSVLSPGVDGVLLVAQAGKTRREVVWRAQEQLNNVRAKLLGVILTHIEYYIPEYIHRHL